MSVSGKVYIIAEAGVNHNGSTETAIQLIDVASEAGADAVKFQTFSTEKMITKAASKAEYQMRTTNTAETQFDMVKKLELDEKAHRLLANHCEHKGLQFLSTPFDLESIELLVSGLNVPYIKISSGDISNAPLLLKAGRTGKPVFLSTGMSTLSDIELALGVLAYGYTDCSNSIPSLAAFENSYCSEDGQRSLKEKVTLLHCTTEYPAPYSEVNLRVMDTLQLAFGLPVGLSDHTTGIMVAVAAVARGAKVIEKHFTLDRQMSGPDHKASLEPEELKSLVQSIRMIEAALGSSKKIPVPAELKNKTIARKSLVALQHIKRGQAFTEANITAKRPGNGISPVFYWQLIGLVSDRDYVIDELILPPGGMAFE